VGWFVFRKWLVTLGVIAPPPLPVDEAAEAAFVEHYASQGVPRSLSRQCFLVLRGLLPGSQATDLAPDTKCQALLRHGITMDDEDAMLDDILDGLGLGVDDLREVDLLGGTDTVGGLVTVLAKCLRHKGLP